MSSDGQKGQVVPPAEPLVGADERVTTGLRVQGRYRIVSELGSGAFGTVWLAEDGVTAQRVAIRFLPRGLAVVPSVARAVQSRARSLIAGSTAHPGLVRVLEVGEVEPGQLFAVMELVEGRRLSAMLSGTKPLDAGSARRLVLDLGGSLESLHNMGLVHGALRPRNVMVLADGRVKLMDVELAGLRDALALDSVLASGPPAEYLAPEQIRGAPTTEKTDIYAFAVILYEMFYGRPPFEAATREAVLAKHLTEPPTMLRRRSAVREARLTPRGRRSPRRWRDRVDPPTRGGAAAARRGSAPRGTRRPGRRAPTARGRGRSRRPSGAVRAGS